MSGKGKLCPECQSDLKLVLLSDLVGQRQAGGLEFTLPAAGAVFNHFDFWVCPECGRTLIYAGETARARARAEGKESEGARSSILGLS